VLEEPLRCRPQGSAGTCPAPARIAAAHRARSAKRLIGYADGDARACSTPTRTSSTWRPAVKQIDEAQLEKSLGEQLRRYDKGGEQFYDTDLGAAQGRARLDPDASLYWFVRMLDGGVDPRYAARRMVRMASEDIGLADPRALRITLDAPSPTSASARPRASSRSPRQWCISRWRRSRTRCYTAYKACAALSRRTAPARCLCVCAMHRRGLMKELDYGRGYRYAHDEEGGFAAGERYWPDDMEAPVFYEPVPRGLEIRLGEKLDRIASDQR
jgi:putative ATPase